jgi:hypothetical protein
VLTELNRQYKRKRSAAKLRGEGFMPYRAALARLRSALVLMLVGGGRPQVGQSPVRRSVSVISLRH